MNSMEKQFSVSARSVKKQFPISFPISSKSNFLSVITPFELREGYVVGKERIVTAISGKYAWKNPAKPEVLVFDVTGRPTQAKIEMKRTGAGWNVTLGIEDWENIAVIK
jgi:hypothetical protein